MVEINNRLQLLKSFCRLLKGLEQLPFTQWSKTMEPGC